MFPRFLPFLLIPVLIQGCSRIPEVEAAAIADAPAPSLLPMDELLALSQGAEAGVADPGPALAARAARLKSRAAALRAAPVTPAGG